MQFDFSVLTIGAAIVDLAFRLTDDEFKMLQSHLNVRPGDWIMFEHYNLLKNTFKKLTGVDYPTHFYEIESLENLNMFEIWPGSTNLGVLCGLTAIHRKNSAFLSAVGCFTTMETDPFATFFSRSLSELSIYHMYEKIIGTHPVGLVFSSYQESEKILGMHPGISSELNWFPDNVKADLIYIDAYELKRGKISRLIDDLILGGKYRIALGLGNHQIIEGKLKTRIIEFIKHRKLYVLLGNITEFYYLLDLKHSSANDINASGLSEFVPNILVTFGKDGLLGIKYGKSSYQNAIVSENIVNTSGAGDTAAGVYLSGILDNESLEETLRAAAYYASQVLMFKGSSLPKGRSE